MKSPKLTPKIKFPTLKKKPTPSSYIRSIVDEAVWKADKWLPEDEEIQNDFYNGSQREKESIIDEYIDDFFDRYYSRSNMKFISTNRSLIIKLIVKRL